MHKFNERIETYLKIIYETEDLSTVPKEVKDALFSAQELTKKCGGELASRQIIANIINFDKNFSIN